MERFILLSLVALLAGCASTETGEPVAKAKSVRLEMPGFLVLDPSDLRALSLGVQTAKPKAVPLSSRRIAQCGAGRCVVSDGAHIDVPLVEADVAAFVNLQKASAKTGQEQTQVDGPVTLRCDAKLCTADLEMETKTEVAGTLLHAFWSGLFGNVARP